MRNNFNTLNTTTVEKLSEHLSTTEELTDKASAFRSCWIYILTFLGTLSKKIRQSELDKPITKDVDFKTQIRLLAAEIAGYALRMYLFERPEIANIGGLGRLNPLDIEVSTARALHPGNEMLLEALTEEIGEVAKALIESDLRPTLALECLQVACVAVRIIEEYPGPS